jgi:hypothetical protein
MEQQKYMTVETTENGPLNRVTIRVSKRHPDEECECEKPGYEGDDIHNDLVMVFNIEDLRIFDAAAIAQVVIGPRKE